MSGQFKVSKSLNKKINLAALKKFKQKPNKDIEITAQKLKEEMIAEFLRHPVTREILDKNTAENYSQTLVGYGNLYSFIGFDYPEDPIAPILNLLNATKIGL